MDMVESNVFARVPLARQEKKIRPPLERGDVARMLASLDRSSLSGCRDYALVLFLLDSGAPLPADTAYSERPLTYTGLAQDQRLPFRERWCSEALAATAGCDLVFVDPDNGIASPTMARGRSDPKHVFIEELAPYLERGQSVVAYHHLGRRGSHAEQITQLLDRLRAELDVPAEPRALRYRPWSPRAFFLLPSSRHDALIRDRVAALLAGAWGTHFEALVAQ